MTAAAISEQQSKALGAILRKFADECEAVAVAVCDVGGNILAQETRGEKLAIANAAALAAGSFAATRELAALIEEPGFKSIFHRGRKSGVLIQAIGEEYLMLVILGPESIEGLVRLFLKNVGGQIETILSEASRQGAGTAGAGAPFEVKAKSVAEKKKK